MREVLDWRAWVERNPYALEDFRRETRKYLPAIRALGLDPLEEDAVLALLGLDGDDELLPRRAFVRLAGARCHPRMNWTLAVVVLWRLVGECWT